jgi:8-oxo-dGTP pyrophosphatase MutT (NUDIX family)
MTEENIEKNIFKDRKGNEKIKPDGREVTKRVAAYGIAIEESKILFVKPAWKQELDLPGGGIERKETVIEGLKREFYEETGMDIEILNKEPVGVKTQLFYADDIDKYFDSRQYFFLVSIKRRDALWKPDAKEIRELIWCDIKDIDNCNIKKTYLKIIKEYLDNIKQYDNT